MTKFPSIHNFFKIFWINLLILAVTATGFSQPSLIPAKDYPVAVTILSDYLQCPSITGKEKLAGEYLAQKSSELGLHVNVFTDDEDAYNFAASLYPLESGKPNIILLNHIDVVGAGEEELWSCEPFSGLVKNDTIFGRGALDMKGMAVMQLMALSQFAEKAKVTDLPYNVTMLSVSAEETGGKKGTQLIVKDHLDKLNAKVIYGEGGAGARGVIPGDEDQQLFMVSVAEKRSLWLKLELKMKAHGHAAIPSGSNANKVMLRAINRLESKKEDIHMDDMVKGMFKDLGNLTGGMQGFVLKHLNWDLFNPFRRKILKKEPLLLAVTTNTRQLTQIHNTPGPPNQIPKIASVYYDCRLLPGMKTKRFLRKFKYDIFDPRIKVSIVDEGPDAPVSQTGDFYKSMERSILKVFPDAEVMPVLFPASTDNNFFRARGIPAYGIMPVELSQELMESIHGTDECIPVNTLYSGIEVYRALLTDLLMKPVAEGK